MRSETKDYGHGQHGLLIIDRTGPLPPDEQTIAAARVVLAGKDEKIGHPCMDCAPNLVLTDHECPEHGWEWDLLVAHDETCPRDVIRAR